MNTDQITGFLSGYFHEDWDAEANTDVEVVALYRSSGCSQEAVVSLVEELESVARERQTETSDSWLLSDYGCYYQPNADRITGSDWLRRLASLLRNSPATPVQKFKARSG